MLQQKSTATITAAARPTEAGAALWFKDAIIYQVHVRSFFDSNDDGIGDFRGLTKRLDYIQQLGVTALWLLPFFPSPLRDGGYDISDYTSVNPIYGTLRDFKTFLREAHRRELRVITEIVMNHTSDQHAWFQRSRRAKPGSKWRDFYVWSDDPHRYADARIIFQDFEASNWTWDPVAEAYFWHRFYHHQPDLNFDNPRVRHEMFKVIDFWFELGVDGVRLDAIPYLYEREGTNCENLPETHRFLQDLRRHVDERFDDRMLLAEANQWPEDAAAYFGDGDECHMNFHFPLMPRLFMATEREDRFPVIDILEQTPELPESCQWAIFLRNHDELTLEMVTDEERDYMYRSYAKDSQARINLGIRRRLATLLRNNRRKIELMNGLLLSLPGTPIIYYGDEIGMGDNIYLGDRDGVRTPMQWNADRNAGFSQANPQKLFLPVVIDSEFHYAVRNVEIEEDSPHSLLWWMRRIIALRRDHRAFGCGSIEFLFPENAKVLAFIRRFEGEQLLVVANLSRFSQCVELDLSAFRGQIPIELFGETEFPPIGQLPYFLTLGPYAFYWFRIDWSADEAIELSPSELPACTTTGDPDDVFQGRTRSKLESALRPFLKRHRWFAGKARTVQSTELLDVFAVPSEDSAAPFQMLLVKVTYREGEPETYLLPVVFAQGEQADNILGDHPGAGILKVTGTNDQSSWTLCDATWEKNFWKPLLENISKRRKLRGRAGEITAVQTKAFRRLFDSRILEAVPEVHGGQQSNTSIVFDERLILKLFRRLNPGMNPDFEVGRFLTEDSHLEHVPDVAGALEYRPQRGQPMTLAVLHAFEPNEGDAWTYTLDELGRFIERVEAQSPSTSVTGSPPSATLLELSGQQTPETVQTMIGSYLQAAELLGRRTGQMHVALASRPNVPDFAVEPFTKLYRRSLYQSMRAQTRTAFGLLKKNRTALPESVRADADQVLEREQTILDNVRQLANREIQAMRIRCHGDLHLGQVLFTGKDFLIIDFEGEPERPVSERRIKTSPLKDVAGMIRSYHYAAHAALLGHAPTMGTPGPQNALLQQWINMWYRHCAAAFLRGYLSEAPPELLPSAGGDLQVLLDAFVLQKMVYEMTYELNNRPDWLMIPLEGILELAG